MPCSTSLRSRTLGFDSLCETLAAGDVNLMATRCGIDVEALVVTALTDNVPRSGGNVFFESLMPAELDQSRVRDPQRALASRIAAIRSLGNFGMFSPTLVPEEIMVDHPQRLRALIVEGCNPLLSYSDASRWRQARAQLDLLLVIAGPRGSVGMIRQ